MPSRESREKSRAGSREEGRRLREGGSGKKAGAAMDSFRKWNVEDEKKEDGSECISLIKS